MNRRRVLRVVLYIAAFVSFCFALFVWLNIDLELSAAYFSGEALSHTRYVWVSINLMLGALAIAALALIIALRQK